MDTDRTRSVPHTAEESAVEYGAMTEGVALLEDSDRIIVEVSGARARDMIDGLVTNDLGPLAAGRCVYAFMLTAKGRVVAEVRVIPKPASTAAPGNAPEAGPRTRDVWLDAPAVCADPLFEHLTKYLPPLYARFDSTDTTRLSIVGPAASEALRHVEMGVAWPIRVAGAGDLGDLEAAPARFPVDDSHPRPSTRISFLLVRRESVEGPGFDLYVPAAAAPSLRTALWHAIRRLGGVVASRAAYEVFRVERGVPTYGREITSDNLPQETGQTHRAISFEKGCYTGQEVVARIHYRGHVNRRLVGFRSEGATAPLVSDSPLFIGEREVAAIRTAVVSPRYGSIALGYARREIDIGDVLSRDAGEPPDVHVCEIPFTHT